MSIIIDRRRLLAGAGLGLVGGGLAGLPFERALATTPITDRKLKIALSNSFIGNKWRLRWRTCSRPRCRWSPTSPRSRAPCSTPATTSASSRSRSPT